MKEPLAIGIGGRREPSSLFGKWCSIFIAMQGAWPALRYQNADRRGTTKHFTIWLDTALRLGRDYEELYGGIVAVSQ
jgi:hypothetical protein